jgi:hypothetical protein
MAPSNLSGSLVAQTTVLFLLLPLAYAQDGGAVDEAQPAPPSVGADVPLAYFGPTPSTVQKELVGPLQLLTAGKLDLDNGTVRLPLYKGYYADGGIHYYILTDTTSEGIAKGLGLNFAGKLSFLTASSGVDDTPYLNMSQIYGRKGRVDFKPEVSVVPGDEPKPFPPKSAKPGAVGDMYYSPYIRISNVGGIVWNAPIVSSDKDEMYLNKFCDGIPEGDLKEANTFIHDKVVQICPRDQTVTLKLTQGFSFSKPVQCESIVHL